MFHKFWRAPQPVKEPLLEEATQKEAEDFVEDLHKVWGEFKALMSVVLVDEANMRTRARAAGFDLKHFKFDPADHPNLPHGLMDWLSCVKSALALKTQLNGMILRRDHMRMRLASFGSDKMTGILQPQSTEFENFARMQMEVMKARQSSEALKESDDVLEY